MKFTIRTNIQAPVNEVFSTMLSTQDMIKWEHEFTAFQPIKGQRRKINSTGNRIYKDEKGDTMKVKEEVIDRIHNQLFRYHLVQQNFISTVTCRFLDQGDSTLMIEETKMKLRPAILNLVGIFMKPAMLKQRKKDLLTFKNLIENRQ